MLVLEELGLPYEIKVLAWHELGTPEHRKANPCGKVPGMRTNRSRHRGS
jgi:glutathione S-transferase